MTNLFRSGALLFAAELVARPIAFSVTFVVSHVLGLHAIALLTLAQSILAYATVAGDAGLGTAAVTRLSAGEERSSVIRDTGRVQLVLTVAFCSVAVPLVGATEAGWLLGVVLCFTPIATALSTTYVLLAAFDARDIAISRILGNVTTAFIGVGGAVSGLPLWAVALAYPVGGLVAMAFVNIRSGARAADLIGVPSWSFLRTDLRNSIGLLAFTLIVHFYSSVLLLLSAGVNHGANLVQIALATRLLLLFGIPAQIVQSVLLPQYSRIVKNLSGKRILRDSLLVAAGGGLLTIVLEICAPFFVPLLFGTAAIQAIGTIHIMLMQIPVALFTSVMTIAMLARRQSVTLGIVYGAAALIQAVLGLAFASSGPMLMALAIVISEVCFALGSAWKVFSVSKVLSLSTSGI